MFFVVTSDALRPNRDVEKTSEGRGVKPRGICVPSLVVSFTFGSFYLLGQKHW